MKHHGGAMAQHEVVEHGAVFNIADDAQDRQAGETTAEFLLDLIQGELAQLEQDQ